MVVGSFGGGVGGRIWGRCGWYPWKVRVHLWCCRCRAVAGPIAQLPAAFCAGGGAEAVKALATVLLSRGRHADEGPTLIPLTRISSDGLHLQYPHVLLRKEGRRREGTVENSDGDRKSGIGSGGQ